MTWLMRLPDWTYCLELLLAMLIFRLPLEKHRRDWLALGVCAAILWLEAALVCPWLQRLGLHVWFYIVFATLLAGMALGGSLNFWEALYCVSCGYFTQHFASSGYLFMAQMGLLDGREPWLPLIYIALYAVTYAAAWLLFSRGMASGGHLRVSRLHALALGAVAVFVVYYLSIFTKQLAEFMHVDTQTPSYGIMLGICQIYAMLVCVLALAAQRLHQHEFHAWKTLEMSRAIWDQKRTQYEFAKENMDQINRKVHDLKHQLSALSTLEADSPRKTALVQELQDMLGVYGSYVDTGNVALDTLLMEKGLYCHLNGIEWKCVADGAFLSFMDVVDLYTMLGNALDNAAESVQGLPEARRYISVTIRREKDFALIQIKNPVEGALRFEGGLPVTRKSDAQNHGYGLRSMRAIAEKYRGTMTVRAEEGVFTLTIMLPVAA